MNKLPIILIIFLAILPISLAATISGTVYDYSLNKAFDATVEINTQPNQLIIAKDGTYSFEVSKGDYTLSAKIIKDNTLISSVEEQISIINDGSFTVDLILFPNLDEDLEEPVVDVDELEDESPNTTLIGIIVAILILAIIFYLFLNRNKPKETEIKKESIDQDDADKVLAIIKKEQGRTTQKDIRKQIPLSEGKISLIITQLEHEGKIQKIKKGRGNIIVLK
tara:strand:- start:4885 stop:5553 length:669 start_codon:yes stop_codon:yes gene_type:complete